MYKVEKTWKSKECYICVAIALETRGFRCGYVGVPKTHVFYGKNYYEKTELSLDDVRRIFGEEPQIGKRSPISIFTTDVDKLRIEDLLDVHGSITYSGENGYPIEYDEDVWFFGFDCGHYNDLRDLSITMPKEYFEQAVEHNDILRDENAEVRTLDYVVDECNCLSEQLKRYDSDDI